MFLGFFLCFLGVLGFINVLSILDLWKEGESLGIVLRPKKRFKLSFKVSSSYIKLF